MTCSTTHGLERDMCLSPGAPARCNPGPATCAPGLPYAARNEQRRRAMTTFTMHEGLPFDETSTPPPVSTGELPDLAQVRDVVTEAYERYRTNTRWRGGRLHPRPRGRLAGLVRGLRGRRPGEVVRDRRRRHGLLDPERVQALRVRAGVRGDRLRRGPAPARGQQHRLPVRLAHGRRAERRPHDEPARQRRRDGHHEPGPGRHGRREVGARSAAACPASPAASSASTRRSTPPSPPPTCATRGSPTSSRATAASTSTRTRPPTSTPGSARSR